MGRERTWSAEAGEDGSVVEDHAMRHRGAQAVRAIPTRVDLDAGFVGQIDPHGARRPVAVAGEHERPVQPPGARAERLDAAQSLSGRRLADLGWGPFAGNRAAAPHPGPQAPGPHGGELAVAQLGWGLDGKALDRVEMTVEDPPDRAIGGRDPAHEPELLAGRRAARARARVEGECADLLELRDRRLGKAGDGGAVALRRGRRDIAQNVFEPGGVVALERSHARASSARPVPRPKSMTRSV